MSAVVEEQHKRHGHRIKTIRTKLATEKYVMTPKNKTTAILCTVGNALLVVAETTGMKLLLEKTFK